MQLRGLHICCAVGQVGSGEAGHGIPPSTVQGQRWSVRIGGGARPWGDGAVLQLDDRRMRVGGRSGARAWRRAWLDAGRRGEGQWRMLWARRL